MFGLLRLLQSAGSIAWHLNGVGLKRWLRSDRRPVRRPALQLEMLEDRVVPTLLGQQLFPADYPWNQNIANAPVAANSAAIIANIGASIGIHPDWGEDSVANGTNPLYGIPFNVVHGNTTPKVTVVVDSYASESDLLQVPIPPNAVLEGDYQNGPNMTGPGYGAGRRGDSHLIVWDQDNNIVYELFGASRPNDPFTASGGPTGGVWHASQESVWNLNANSFRTLGYTSADAAGLTILPGLARPDEGLPVAQGGQGAINHALRFTLPSGDVNPQYIYPASHMVYTSSGSANLPLGGRLRLMNTPTVNAIISTLGPQAQIIARAMQQYGLVLADIGTAMYVTGSSSAQDANNNITHVWNIDDVLGLRAITAGHFQVVDLTPQVTGLSATNGAAGNTVTIVGRNFTGSAGHLRVLFGTAVAASVTLVDDTHINVVVPNGTGTVHVQVQSGVNAIDPDDPNHNVKNPIFGYGISTTSAADQFSYASGPTISGTNSTVSFATSTVASGVADALSIVVKDTTGAAVTGLASGAFSFVLSGGTSGGTFSPVSATATPGTYTANFLGTTAGTASTLTATIGGVTLTNRPTITVTVGAISGAVSTVSFATATVASGGTDPLTLVVKDAAGNAISGLTSSAFSFVLSGGTSAGTYSPATATATPGVYTANFIGTTVGTASTLTATISGVALNNRPTITVTAGAVNGTNSTVSFATATVASGGTDPLTLVVKDAAGNAISGLASGAFGFVLSGGTSAGTFSPVTATATPGTYTANFIGTTAGSASTLTATIGGVTLTNRPTITVTVGGVSGTASTVSFAAATVAAGGADPLTLVVKDAAGNAIGGLPNSAFGFTLTGGTSSGTFGTVTATATPGEYTSVFTAGGPGTTSTLTAVVNGVTLAAHPTVTVGSSSTFSDDFSMAGPGQQLQGPWIQQVGAYQVNTTARTATGAASLNLATVSGISSANEAVSAVVTLAPGQIAGLVARYAGAGDQNMYHGVLIAGAGNFDAYIYRNLGGAWTSLFGQTYAGSITNAMLEFDVVGSSLRLFLNGSVIGYANDTALTAAGSVGMRATAGAVMKNFSAAPLTLQNSASATTFSDNFAAPGSNAQLSNFWFNQAGNFQVGAASAVGVGGLNLATVNGTSSANEAVSATVTLTPGQIAGLVARYSGLGDQNMYHGVLIAGAGSYDAYIYRNLGGAWTSLFSQTYAGSVTNATLEFDVVGSSLRLFLNGAVIGYANDTALTAPGSVGMRVTAGAVMKNFSASPLTLQNSASPTTFSDNFTTPGSNAQLSNFWLNQTGNFQVGGGSAVGVGGLDLAIVNGITSANEAVAATVTLAPGQVGGLVLRYSGPGDQNMYHGVLIAGAGTFDAYIYRNVGGAWTPLFGRTYAGAINNATLEFDAIGSSLRLFLNGALVGHANDKALTTPGSIGMRVTAGAVMKNFVAAPLTPGNRQLPFFDTFATAGPNAQLTNSWLNQAGNLSVAGGAASGVMGLNLATVNGASAADVTVQADVSVSAVGQAAGLVARYAGSGDQNMYVATVMQTGAGVYHVFMHVNVNGAWTLLGSRNVSSGNGALSLAIAGSTMTVSFGGAALFTVLDSSLSAAGAVGLRLTAGARVDNFSAS